MAGWYHVNDEATSLSSDLSAEQTEALRIAGELIDAGAPVFAAKLCPEVLGEVCPIGERYGAHGVAGFHLPNKWQLTVPSRVWLERWRPGDALAVVGGHVLDVIDEDPRAGGDVSVAEMKAAGQWPRVFGIAETPSGGRHHVISPTGEPECNGFMPGLDLQSGAPDGRSRAFAFIAPTVKASKVDGSPGMYRWVKPPELDMLAEFVQDDSLEGLLARVSAARRKGGARSEPKAGASADPGPFATPSSAGRAGAAAATGAEPGGQGRAFTRQEAEAFLRPVLMDVAAATVGGIEEAANRAAVALSHFVPAFFSVDEAMALLRRQLSFTAYDESHPASAWTAEKFRPVLDGRRPVADPWVASERAPSLHAVTSIDVPSDGIDSVDAVSALIAEMLSAQEIAERPPPRPLIKGLLNFDSESWIIGPPGSKKSFVAMDMAAHVATGKPWQGIKTAQADVIMIVAEGAGGMPPRIKAWERRYGPMGGRIRFLPRPVQAADVKAWAVLVEACRQLAPGMVVVDTQARNTVGLDENNATEIGIYLEAVRALREATRACVLTIHHTGRKGGDARGSSAIDGAQHTELKVESQGLSGRLSTEKQKDMDAMAPLRLLFEMIEVGIDDEGEPVTSLVLDPDAWSKAEAEASEGGQEDLSRIREPEAWTYALFDHPLSHMKRRILQALKDLAGSAGRTEEKIQNSVAERWYGGGVGRIKGSINTQDWNKHWTGVKDATWSEGKVVIPGEDGGWRISPDYLEGVA